MNLTESYKARLKQLAGILNEASPEDRAKAFADSDRRIPYNKDLMIQAIQEGREVGILFQSNNEKYKMPMAKYRVIYPVAMGTSKAGNEVVRAVHKIGQSESAARRTGRRSQEVEDEWRMFKVSNIRGMWFTGKFYNIPPRHYNAADKGMVNVEVAANFPEIIKFQQDLIAQMKAEQRPKPKIVSLFKPVDVTQTEPQGTISPETTIEPERIDKYVPKRPYKKSNPNVPREENPAVNPKKTI